MQIAIKNVAGFAVASMLLCMAQPIHAQDEPQKLIDHKLKDQFTLTRTTADRGDIVTPGSIVVLHKDGLLMYQTSSPMPPTNTYKNGKVSQGMGGFGRDLGITMLAPGGATSANYARRKFVDGEKFWITSYAAQKDGVVFQFYSDPYDGVRYYGQLKVPFPKGAIPPPDDVMRLIAEVVTSDNPPQEAAPPAPIAPPAQTSGTYLAPVAPPPPPPDAPPVPPKTIALGQTKDQVAAILGQPLKVANLGPKEIDYYSDMKVIFVDGAVTDIQ